MSERTPDESASEQEPSSDVDVVGQSAASGGAAPGHAPASPGSGHEGGDDRSPADADADPDEAREKVRELVKDTRIAMLTTVDASGRLVSRPMGVQDVEFDGDLWFFADESSAKVGEIAHDAQVNVSFSSGSSWLSVSGTASLVRDRERIHELWNPVAGAWFPEGPDTPSVVLVRVEADSAEYWDSPGGRLATAISLVKAKLTGRRYDGGENATVEL
ncbi:pyridoxamine 5'-phosphate oxidase family protein [Puerhibacterium sp. TATVAM-FAB25]|uniref:pyridoxamine 5'-phosphate oxidase family protein n=1 Tax=Puerhibacterium sp. TATVAM-FAB25 TaxID=3093699 RepID=UPI00397B6987